MSILLLENIVLKNLSFFDTTSIDQLILSIDEVDLKSIVDLNLLDLEKCLLKLKRKGKVKRIKNGDTYLWLRINPGKITWYKKIFHFLGT